ncbi:hypothetical protein F5Y09DRAFT_197903 [Xylaria sp. FL1042]|nr:hypothetical protein F5Y09DRAFT_197903 [Xylaria sp. FL1042]
MPSLNTDEASDYGDSVDWSDNEAGEIKTTSEPVEGYYKECKRIASDDSHLVSGGLFLHPHYPAASTVGRAFIYTRAQPHSFTSETPATHPLRHYHPPFTYGSRAPFGPWSAAKCMTPILFPYATIDSSKCRPSLGHINPPRDTTQPLPRRWKLAYPVRPPPAFWDNLSKIPLMRSALRELGRRNASTRAITSGKNLTGESSPIGSNLRLGVLIRSQPSPRAPTPSYRAWG